ncbi:hypothetical protein SAMN04488128_10730 [Chitinophaga eiseniae]|uniref:Uncharacterized protein n=1 Tax=Chitinophaga eiseniae TaxID=634771 RepID=A0A1T4TZ03_9BACT|nr:hypothetical protein [Chitinophaga eiseniae]SKA45531.1 hypothetical protein SAMN04488128_10730 [Chitinophaga eiseniae]
MLTTCFVIAIVGLLFGILRQLILVSTNILYLSKDDALVNAGDETAWPPF